MQLNHHESILNIKLKCKSLHDSQLKQTIDVAEFFRKGASQVWIPRQCSATITPNHAIKKVTVFDVSKSENFCGCTSSSYISNIHNILRVIKL